MKKILMALSLFVFLFGDTNNIEPLSKFNANPYLKENQENLIKYLKQNEYRNNYELMDSLEDLYIYASDKAILKESRDLFENNKFILEETLVDKTTGKSKTIKKSDRIIDKYEIIKNKLNNNLKHIFVLEKDQKYAEAESLYFKRYTESKKNKPSLEELVFQLKYMIKKGNYVEAKELFNLNTERFIKSIESGKEMFKDNTRFVIGDLFAYGSILYYEDKDLFNKYKKISLASYNNDLIRFNAIMGIVLQEKEDYISAELHLEEIRSTMQEQTFLNILLECYYKGARKDILNQNYQSAWNQSRKAIIMSEQILINKELRIKYTPLLIELKKILKTSSGFYIAELLNNGENSHSARIKEETIRLLDKSLTQKEKE